MRAFIPCGSGIRSVGFCLLSCLLFLIFGGCQTRPMAGGICLVKNQKARAAIIIPDKAIAPEQFAAEELQYHIQKATGVKLAIYAEKDRPAGLDGLVYLGNCRKTVEAGIDTAALPPSGHVIKTIDGNLFLAGKDRVRGKSDVSALLQEDESCWNAN